MPEASKSGLNLPRTVLNCLKLLISIENVLKSARGFCKCLEPSKNGFRLPETFKYYWEHPIKCQKCLQVF